MISRRHRSFDGPRGPGRGWPPDEKSRPYLLFLRLWELGRGYRLATSVDGTLTGRGGDIVIIDDPIKPQHAAALGARLPGRRGAQEAEAQARRQEGGRRAGLSDRKCRRRQVREPLLQAAGVLNAMPPSMRQNDNRCRAAVARVCHTPVANGGQESRALCFRFPRRSPLWPRGTSSQPGPSFEKSQRRNQVPGGSLG
jgi:hypothetical protein